MNKLTAEKYYDKIKNKLGTQALLSYQDGKNRLYGKDAICKILNDYTELVNGGDTSQDKALHKHFVSGMLPSEYDIKEAAAITCRHRSVKLGWILGAKWMRGETLVRLRNCR